MYVYRCETCNMVLYNKKYAHNEKCPFCKNILKITFINQNSKHISIVNTIRILTTKLSDIVLKDFLTYNEINSLQHCLTKLSEKLSK